LEESIQDNCSVEWAARRGGASAERDTMLEELMQTGELEMERILRLRGYL